MPNRRQGSRVMLRGLWVVVVLLGVVLKVEAVGKAGCGSFYQDKE